VKVGEDKAAIDPFYTVVLTADEKESGVLLTGTKGSELVLVRYILSPTAGRRD